MTTLSFNLSGGAIGGAPCEKGDEVLITQLDHEGNRGPVAESRGKRGVVSCRESAAAGIR